MQVMIYYYKRDFEVQKAERWFKERKISFQVSDMKRKGPGIKEITLFARQAGLSNLIEKSSKAWLESTARFLNGEQALIEALAAQPQLLKGPIVRGGSRVTVGFQPEAWSSWNET